MKTTQYGMSSDPTHTTTKKEKAALDARAQDEMGTPEFPDDPLDANDLDDPDDDDDEIGSADLDDSTIGDDADDDEQDDPEEKPVKDTDKNSLTDKAEMVHACENCGKENFVLAPKGYRYKKTAETKPVALRQRLKHVDEALAPIFAFKHVYREARRPKQAPFLS